MGSRHAARGWPGGGTQGLGLRAATISAIAVQPGGQSERPAGEVKASSRGKDAEQCRRDEAAQGGSESKRAHGASVTISNWD